MAKPLDAGGPKKKVETSDSDTVSMMGMAMLDGGGLDIIKKALEGSQDPGQVVGQFLAQMVGQIAEFTQANMGIDPKVFLQPDGFLDQILDYIERKLNLPPEFSDQVYGETLEVIKAAAANPEAQGGGQPPAGAPAPPAAAPPAGPAPLDGGP